MAKPTMDPLTFLRKTIEDGDPDLLRYMVRTFAETLMSAEASATADVRPVHVAGLLGHRRVEIERQGAGWFRH